MSQRDSKNPLVGPGPATGLRAYTPARVGLGRTGVSQQFRDVLAFQLAHAWPRDAVHARMKAAAVQAAIAELAARPHGSQVTRLRSNAQDRTTYLQRPDLGRQLDENSRNALANLATTGFDLALVVADGLSALAAERHVAPLLAELLPRVADWKVGPICVVEQGRVAIGDEIGLALRAELSVVLIGERPGLSSPDSLGAYVTWQPRPGRTDAERNCISNIRPEGLSYRDAAEQLMNCLLTARRRKLTGTALGRVENLLPKDNNAGEQP
jgi:ethanolamine ammonia-lyase small subunit